MSRGVSEKRVRVIVDEAIARINRDLDARRWEENEAAARSKLLEENRRLRSELDALRSGTADLSPPVAKGAGQDG